MSYNGSGTFQINTSGQPVVAGTVISSTAFNALTADLATGLSTAITKDGQTTTTARIPFAAGINSSLTTDSSSTTTGSIITAGGVGIVKNLYVGANTNIAGTLGVTGVATFSAAPIYSSLTASSAVATDASKALVSVTNTGTGNNVLATSPTLVTPVLGAASATSITVAAGAVGTPSITTTGDTNTGIFFPAADTIAFAEGGAEVARFDSSGNLGIGASPSYRLDVNATSFIAASVSTSNSGAGNIRIADASTTSASAPYIGSVGNNLTFGRIGTAEYARIDSSGNFQFNSGYGSVAVAYGCRAWCQYNGSRTIIGSANITSITVNGTGDSKLNFTTAMPDANYSAVASTNEDGGTAKFCNVTQPATSDIRVVTYTLAGLTTNNTYNFVAVFR